MIWGGVKMFKSIGSLYEASEAELARYDAYLERAEAMQGLSNYEYYARLEELYYQDQIIFDENFWENIAHEDWLNRPEAFKNFSEEEYYKYWEIESIQHKIEQLREWGFGPEKLIDYGVSPDQLLDAGVTPKQLMNAGVKFSEVTPDVAMKIAQDFQTRAPIEIPDVATVKASSKVGYEQITYKWNDGTYKYEVRWHTRTADAPLDQGNTWVIERTIPGNGGQKPQSFFKIGNTGTEADWVTGKEWYEAIAARKAGVATLEQVKILDLGHWKE